MRVSVFVGAALPLSKRNKLNWFALSSENFKGTIQVFICEFIGSISNDNCIRIAGVNAGVIG